MRKCAYSTLPILTPYWTLDTDGFSTGDFDSPVYRNRGVLIGGDRFAA